LVIRPAVASIRPLALNLFHLQAALSAASAPLGGAPLAFTAGAQVLCTTHTAANGTATCDASTLPNVVAVIVAGGYSVSFAGTPDFAAAKGSAPLVG
jgi:hypothetical protein